MKRPYVVSVLIAVLVFLSAFSASAQTVNCTGVTAWTPGIAVTIGELVTYNNQEYKTLQSHTTETGWEPPNTPALFSFVGNCSGTVTPTPTPTASAAATVTATATVLPTATPATTATATATPSATPSNACAQPWVATTAYTGGTEVSYGGQNYQAAYWTQNNNPSTNSGPAGSGEPWIPLGACGAGGWSFLANAPTFTPNSALLLTDGTVMVQSDSTSNWWRLTPDINGSYVNGTWSQAASLPSGYSPLYYGSAVLPDGRLIVEGGEYNGSATDTTLGAIYDPVANTWTAVAPPAGWTTVGDAPTVVLPNGTLLLGNCCSSQEALLDASTLTWTPTGTGKADSDNEEGFALLPNGKVLTIDIWNTPQSEIYDPATGSWTLAGSTGVSLVNPCSEIGPSVLRPDGTVFAIGGDSNTAIYNPASGTWTAGPTLPNGEIAADGPAALLPNGHVLLEVGQGPNCYTAPTYFYEFDGTSLNSVPGPSNVGQVRPDLGRMLELPTGQILYTDMLSTNGVAIYTPAGTYQSAWQPTVTSVPATVTHGATNYAISGTQFNGLSQGAMYGDDAQMATNYPLVRITNNSTGHIFYCRTHNHSSMGVATGSQAVSTEFDVPASIETGASTLEVVANGIPSSAVSINVQ